MTRPACTASVLSSVYSTGVSETSRPPTVMVWHVHGQVAGRDDRLVRRLRGVSHGDPHAGEKFAHAERLGEVVVGPGVQRADLVRVLAADRQDQDRCLGPLAKAPGDLDAVLVRQAEIEDDQIRTHLAAASSPSRAEAASKSR